MYTTSRYMIPVMKTKQESLKQVTTDACDVGDMHFH